MPIINYQGSRQVEFGKGDILVSPGLLDMEQVVGVLCFTENGTGIIGDRTDHEPSTVLEATETPVRLTFDKIESIDVVIKMLEETKAMMSARVSGIEKPNFRMTSNTGIEIRHFHCPACEKKLYELVDWESEECVYCGQEFHGEMSADYEPDIYFLMVDPKTGVPFIYKEESV